MVQPNIKTKSSVQLISKQISFTETPFSNLVSEKSPEPKLKSSLKSKNSSQLISEPYWDQQTKSNVIESDSPVEKVYHILIIREE